MLPKLAEVYRSIVRDLHAALNKPDARAEAVETRGLIEGIRILATGDGHCIELTGNIVSLVALPNGNSPSPFENSVKVVAGTRFVQARTQGELRRSV